MGSLWWKMSQGFRECTWYLVIKSQEGLTQAQGTTHAPAAAQPQLALLGWAERAAAFAGLSSTRPLVLSSESWISSHLFVCASAGQMAPWWQPPITPHLELLARSRTEGWHARRSKCLAFSSAPLPSAEVSLVFNPSASWLGQLFHSQALSYIRGDFIP